MLEAVFSASACGSLKMAQHFGQGRYSGGCIGVILSHGDGSEPTEDEKAEALRQAEETARQEWEAGSPMGGDPGDVFGFELKLSVGDISEELPGPKRQAVLLRQYSFVVPDMEEETNELLLQAARALTELLDRSANGEELRLWYSDDPDELCGFFWLMDRLETLGDRCGPILAAKLPHRELQDGQGVVTHSGWSGIGPGAWSRYVPLARPVSPLLRHFYAQQWRALRQENAPLRACLNGALVSVPEDFYDGLIRREITAAEPEFQEHLVIGRVLNRVPGVSDALIAQRIQALLESGALEAVTQPPADGARYWRRLRRTALFNS